jgi:adenylate kinase
MPFKKEIKMDLVLIGGPGTGKGTQAELLQDKLDLTHIASGDLFRENIGRNTKLGVLAKRYIDQGQLVPDNVTVDMIRDRLEKPDVKKGILFDGFPRTLAQAQALDDLLAHLNRKIDHAIYLVVSEDEIVRRLSGRLICRECQTPFHRDFNPFIKCPYNKCSGEYLYQREDDKPETVRERLKVFQRQTSPLIDHYKAKGLLIEIDGERSVEEVFERILESLKA